MLGLKQLLIGAMVVVTSAAAIADEFPSKPIEVVIHSSYGGGTDTTARMMMIRSRRNLETDMFVVSKRGGSGATAQGYVLSKPADGYTIMAGADPDPSLHDGPGQVGHENRRHHRRRSRHG